MLNEAYAVFKSMSSQKIPLPYVWHDQMKFIPRHDSCVEVHLNKNGNVAKFHFTTVPSNIWKDQRTMRAYEYKVSGIYAGVRFPAMMPQYKKTAKDLPDSAIQLEKKEIDVKLQELRLSSFRDVLKKKIKILKETVAPILLEQIVIHKEQSKQGKLIQRLLKAIRLVDESKLVKDLLDDNEQLNGLIANNKAILITFECHRWRSFADYPINHHRTCNLLDSILKSSQPTEHVDSQNELLDAYGNSLSGYEDKFPVIKIEGFNDIILRAANPDVPSFIRWGKIGARSFRVGAESRKWLTGALEWITQSDFEDKIWRNLQKITGRKELIIVFTDRGFGEDVSFIDLGIPESEAVLEKDYVVATRPIINALQGIPPEQKPNCISFFSIRNTSNKMVGVHNHGNFQTDELIQAAILWEKAARNIPFITFYDQGESISQKTPYPAEVVPLVNRANKPEKAKKEPRLLELEDAFTLFAGTSWQQTTVAERLIQLFSNRPIRKLLSYAPWFRNWYPAEARPNITSKYKKFLLKLPVVIGISLYKTNITKEVYMNDTPFLFGQYLALIDEAHMKYYQAHNSGKSPKSLIGSRSLSSAMENPINTINTVGQRAVIYIEWLKTQAPQPEKDGKLANLRQRIEENARQLSQLDLPNMLDETEKAQLTLGYLAGPQSKL